MIRRFLALLIMLTTFMSNVLSLGSEVSLRGQKEPDIPDIMYIFINQLLEGTLEQHPADDQEGAESDDEDDPEESKLEAVTFADVRGQDRVLEEVKEIVEFLKNPEKFQKFGAKLPKGVLLQGPPGTGKTLIARAIAGEAGCKFYYTSASSFVDRFVGMGAHNIREFFDKARKSQPSIVFIDEIDAVGAVSRYSSGGGSEEYRQTLNELLNQLDGFKKDENVIIIAATNLAKALDPALLRPGRFTRVVEVPVPTKKGRVDTLRYYLSKIELIDEKITPELLAEETAGFSGADLENLVNEAAICAARSDACAIKYEHFEEAWDKIKLGLPSDIDRDAEQRKKTAYHEAGHTLVKLCCQVPVVKVTIMPRGRTLGVTKGRLKYESSSDYSRDELLNEIKVSQGGYLAEKIVFGQVHPGVCSDLERANQCAHAMVYEWGMGDGIQGIAGSVFTSEKHREMCDQAVKNILDQCLAESEKIIKDNMPILEKLAQALLEKETLNEHEIYAISGIDKPKKV